MMMKSLFASFSSYYGLMAIVVVVVVVAFSPITGAYSLARRPSLTSSSSSSSLFWSSRRRRRRIGFLLLPQQQQHQQQHQQQQQHRYHHHHRSIRQPQQQILRSAYLAADEVSLHLAASAAASSSSAPASSKITTNNSAKNYDYAATASTSASAAAAVASASASAVELQYTEIMNSDDVSSSSSSSTLPQQQYHQQPHHQHHLPPPVIFLHGLLGNKKNFIGLGTALAAQLDMKRRLLAVDLRNHGDNHHDWRDSMGHDEMAMDVIALLDRLEIPKAVIVGHSMGGKVAQAMALLHPHRVAGLMVLDMAPVSYIHPTRNLQDSSTSAETSTTTTTTTTTNGADNTNHQHPSSSSTSSSSSSSSHTYDANWKTIRDILHVLTNLSFQPGMTKRQVDVLLRPHISDPAIRAFCLTNLEIITIATNRTLTTVPTTTTSEASATTTTTTTTTTMPRWKIPMTKIAQQLDRLAAFDITQHQAASYQQQQQQPQYTTTASSSSSSSSPPPPLTYDGDVFFITGGQSKFVRSVHLPIIRRYFPNHMVSTIRGAGHWVHAEAPDETIALMKQFLDRSSSS